MPPRDFYSPENVRKAAEALTRETRRYPNFSDRARAAMLRESLEEGDIWGELERIAEQEQDYNYDDEPRAGEDFSTEELRQYATPEYFRDDIPFRGQDVDPDYEDYTGYRLATQNPKVLEMLQQQQREPKDVGELESLQNRIYEDIRAGRVDRRDLQQLTTLAQGSRLLEDAAADPDIYDIATFIEREGTGNPEAVIDPELDDVIEQGARDLRSALRRPLEAEQNARSQRERLARNLNAARGAVARSGDLTSPELIRQVNALEAEGLGLAEPETLSGAEQQTNRLNEIVRDLNRIEREAEAPARSSVAGQTDVRDAIRGRILPQVAEALGERGVRQAIDRVVNQQRAEENLENQNRRLAADALRSGPIAQQQRELTETYRRPMSPRAIDETAVNLGTEYRQEPLPGLWELTEAARQETNQRRAQESRAQLDVVLDQYPEVRRVLEAAPKSSERKAPRGGESSKTYQQFMDLQQGYTSPENRQAAYDKVLSQYPEDARGNIAGMLQRIEADYTSGNTAMQRDAVAQLEAMGGTLEGVEKPAVSPRRPVIGGGRYVSLADINADPELSKLYDRINKRAEDVNRVLTDIDRGALKEMFPARASTLGAFRSLGLAYDENTGEVREVDPRDPSAYRVEVMGANRGDIPKLRGARDLADGNISENALRFFAENPVFSESSVSFKTALPGETLSYEAPGALPKPVADAFGEFVRSEALKGTLPGTLVANSPVSSGDLLRTRLRAGETPETSSTVRKLKPFEEAGQALPNVRGVAYQSAGFGPTDVAGAQYTFISPEGEAIPIQFRPSEPGLRGRVQNMASGARVAQGALPATSPRYFGSAIPGLGVEEVNQIGRNIRRTPASLLPGAADLIPTREAVRRGFQEGPVAMGQQMGTDFLAGLPLSIPAAAVLSTPVVASLAPGIGAGLVTVAGAEALDEAVKQQTGEGIVPKLRQFIGTEERTGAAAKPKPARPYVIPRVVPTKPRNPVIQEAQNRFGLAKERFNPAKGEFGLSELLFGR